MPRFSILIPVHNVEAYLEECLRSVISQTFTDFEVIAVDDGSTDSSGEILERHRMAFSQQEIPYTVIHQENQGLSGARNTALDHATGEYILFVDSDDMLTTNALERLDINLLGEDLLCFNGQRLFEENQRLEPSQPMDSEGPVSGWDYYCRHALEARAFAFVCVVLRCYRRQYLLDAGLRFQPGIYHEDNLFTPLACLHAAKVSVIPDVLYTYRVRPGSIMGSRSLKHRQDLITIANSLGRRFEAIAGKDPTVLYRYLTQLYQVAFAESTSSEDRQLLSLVDWQVYRRASRTKARHRLYYCALRLSPSLFRTMLHLR